MPKARQDPEFAGYGIWRRVFARAVDSPRLIGTLKRSRGRQPVLVKTFAGIIIFAVVGLIALWSGPADAHAIHAESGIALHDTSNPAQIAHPPKHCDTGHTCHVQILPTALPGPRYLPTYFLAQPVLRDRLPRSLILLTDPPPPRA